MAAPGVEALDAKISTKQTEVMETPATLSAAAATAIPAKAVQIGGTPAAAYKVVKVRKPDGTIVKVRRLVESTATTGVVPEVKPATAAAQPVAQPGTSAAKPITAHKPAAKASAAQVATTKIAETPTQSATARGVTSHQQSAPQIPAAQTNKSAVVAPSTTTSSSEAVKNDVHKYDIVIPENVVTATTAGSRIFRNVRRLGVHGSRIASGLVPDWDVGDLEDGDEELSDDDDSDDEKYDSDSDSKSDKGHTRNDFDEKHGEREADINKSLQAGGDLATAAAKATTQSTHAARAPPPQTTNTTANPVAEAGPKTKGKDGTIVNEKAASEDSTGKKAVPDPESGREVTKRYHDWSRYVIWTIEIMLPLLFMIIGILVAVMNGKDFNSTMSNGVAQSLKVAVSIWPIIFAAVVAQTLRVYATYKVERGVRLMTLEQLVNSHSVASSIKVPFVLRRFNLITLALFALWAFSPLASQAMQRVYNPNEANQYDYMARMAYVDTINGGNYLNISTTLSTYQQWELYFKRLYTAAFLPSDTSGGMDYFYNPLIPVYSSLQNTTLDVNGWKKVNSTQQNSWSSLYGIPVVPVKTSNSQTSSIGSSTYDFTMRTSYLDLVCSTPNITAANVIMEIYPDIGNLTALPGVATTMNLKGSPATITWASRGFSLDNATSGLYAFSVCNVTQPAFLANLTCNSDVLSTFCTVTSMKPDGTVPFNYFTFALPWTDNIGATSRSGTDTERYLADPAAPASGIFYGLNVSNITAQQFNTRLSILANTMWLTGFAPTHFSTSLPEDLTAADTGYTFNTADGTSTNDNAGYAASVVAATRTFTVTQWKTEWGWLAALFVSAALLLAAALFSIYWDLQTISPDILGFASSVLRKSKYVQVPPVDSAASGAERARALGEIRVMMQDVKPKAPVGRIVLGTAHAGARRIEQGRMYR